VENGGNFSSSKVEASSTSGMEEQLMQSKILKDKELNLQQETERLNSFGQLSILIRSKLKSQRDFIQTSVSIATDHSILFQDYQ
jgi:hypothetical protein